MARKKSVKKKRKVGKGKLPLGLQRAMMRKRGKMPANCPMNDNDRGMY